MTIHSQLVKLKVEKEFQRRWKSKTKRVDAIWYKFEKDVNEQYVQLVTKSHHPALISCGTNNTLDKELESMPVKQDAVRDRKNTPKDQLHRITAIQGHPGMTGDRDYLKNRMNNLRDQWITKDKLLEINAKLKSQGYTKGIDIEEIKMHPTKPLALYRIKVGEME